MYTENKSSKEFSSAFLHVFRSVDLVVGRGGALSKQVASRPQNQARVSKKFRSFL